MLALDAFFNYYFSFNSLVSNQIFNQNQSTIIKKTKHKRQNYDSAGFTFYMKSAPGWIVCLFLSLNINGTHSNSVPYLIIHP